MTADLGSGDNRDKADSARYAKLRRRMVDLKLVHRGIHDHRVLDAMLEVPRHLFVPEAWREESYDDGPLPIGFGQTISQPLTVAYMLQALRLQGPERVLEIGTGSGYSAAVLSHLAREVHSIERIPELAASAAERLTRWGYRNVQVHQADGTLGLPDQAPFDAIVVAAGSPRLPPPYVEQLSEGGRILIPIGEPLAGQSLMRFTRQAGELVEEDLGLFAFVPLLGKFGAG